MERPKALIGDSSVFMRTLLKSHLESLNFNVVATAKDSEECMSKYPESMPDIALLDISIAEEDDFAPIRAAQKCNPSSTVIVMIPEQPNFPEMVVEAVRAGARGYIRKPISPQELKLRMTGALRR